MALAVGPPGEHGCNRVAEDAARDLDLAAYYGVRVVRIDAGLVERDLPAALRVLGGHIG